MPFFDNDGNRLYYEDTGGERPPIVFSHGAFLDHTIWAPVIERIAGDFRCLTWDARGHGMSEANGVFDFWDAATDVIALLDAAGIERAVLVGMSQGGWLTQRVALRAAERVTGMVLQGTSVHPLSAEEAEGYGQLSQGWLSMGPVGELADAVLGIQFAGTEYDGSRFVERWQSKPPAAWQAPWHAILHGRTDDIADRLGEITVPALVIHGTSDVAFPVSAAAEMHELLGDSRGLIEVDGAPHAMSLTHPEQLSAAIHDFASALTASAA